MHALCIWRCENARFLKSFFMHYKKIFKKKSFHSSCLFQPVPSIHDMMSAPHTIMSVPVSCPTLCSLHAPSYLFRLTGHTSCPLYAPPYLFRLTGHSSCPLYAHRICSGSLATHHTTIIKVLFAEMYVNVVFVIRCLYSAVSLTLVKE